LGTSLFTALLALSAPAFAQSVFENEYPSSLDFLCGDSQYLTADPQKTSTARSWSRVDLDLENNHYEYQQRDAQNVLEKSILCKNGLVLEKKWFLSGSPWRSQTIQRPVPTMVMITTLTYFSDTVSQVEKTELFRHNFESPDDPKLLRRWIYQIGHDRENTLEQADYYDEQKGSIIGRVVYSPTGEESKFRFFYTEDEILSLDRADRIPQLNGFEKLEAPGSPKAEYTETQTLGLELYQKNAAAIPVVIIDSGVDIWNPEFAGKIWKNTGEEKNGIDDDGNGLVDDIVGFTDNPRTGSLPIPDVRLPRMGAPSRSHGTLIASIIAKENDSVAIVPVSEIGEYNSPDFYTKLQIFLKSHKMRFTNLSFSIDQDLFQEIGDSSFDRSPQLTKMILDTPEILHVVAAGNGNIFTGKGKNLNDELPGRVLPAMAATPNVLVVGSLQTAELSLDLMPSYQMSAFSNYGEKYVDILAPGENMCGAAMGGGTYCESGTSFAAPFVISKIILPLVQINPLLSNSEIKEIVLKTAYIPDLKRPMPVRSGGMINPYRAIEVAKLRLANPNASIEDLALEARKQGAGQVDGEEVSEEYLQALKNLWRAHGI
ncbi:MAG: S8 family serine peptidase, partial [Pseudobdellovibrionaceae bacterium]